MPYVKELQAVYRRVPTKCCYAGRLLSGPDAVAGLAQELIGDASQERFLVFHLDNKNRLISFQTIGIGSVNSCPISPTEIFKGALLANAAAIIACHNHPSGDCAPSKEDDALTVRLVKTGRLIEVPVLDHVVIGDGDFFSYAQEGRIEQ